MDNLRKTELEVLSMLKDLAGTLEHVVDAIETGSGETLASREHLETARLLLNKVRNKSIAVYKRDRDLV